MDPGYLRRDGRPSTCHPERKASARGLCGPCWDATFRKTYKKNPPIDLAGVAALAGITKKQARQVLNIMLKTITGALRKKERVGVMGFGTFKVIRLKPRPRWSPHYRMLLQEPARNRVIYNPSKHIKQLMDPHRYKER